MSLWIDMLNFLRMCLLVVVRLLSFIAMLARVLQDQRLSVRRYFCRWWLVVWRYGDQVSHEMEPFLFFFVQVLPPVGSASVISTSSGVATGAGGSSACSACLGGSSQVRWWWAPYVIVCTSQLSFGLSTERPVPARLGFHNRFGFRGNAWIAFFSLFSYILSTHAGIALISLYRDIPQK